MSSETIIGIIGIVITTAIAIFAILDARRLVKESIDIDRKLAYLKVKNDLVWEFIDPTESAYSPQIAKGLHVFGFLSQELNPKVSHEAIKESVEKESLQFAEELVNSGRAQWQKDLDSEKVRHEIKSWQAAKNVAKVNQMIGDKNDPFKT